MIESNNNLSTEKYSLIELNGKIIRRVTVDMIINFQENQLIRTDFNAKLVSLLSDLIYTNEDIDEFYNMHFRLVSGKVSELENAYYAGKYYKRIATIIHDLKYTVDQLITLICLLRKEPIYIDSIGELYNERRNINKIMQNIFEGYEEYLKELNNMENSFKHHFTNGIKRKISNYEPIIYYFYCKDYSNLKCDIKEKEKSMEYMIENFNIFLNYVMTLLQNLSCTYEMCDNSVFKR